MEPLTLSNGGPVSEGHMLTSLLVAQVKQKMNISLDLIKGNFSPFVEWKHNFTSNFNEEKFPLNVGEKDHFEGKSKH